MRISTRSWPACVCTSEAYLAACCGAAIWSMRILMPVSFVKRGAISASFLSESGAKLFQQRYEISRCCPRAGGTPVARMLARPAPVVVVRKWRRVIDDMTPPLSFTEPAGRLRPAIIPQLERGRALGLRPRILWFPVLVPLAKHLLVELSDAGLGQGVEDLDRLDDAPGLRDDAGEGALDPLGVRHGDHRRLQHLRVAHDQVLDVHARHPLAPGLDQILGPVGDLDVAFRVDRGDVSSA